MIFFICTTLLKEGYVNIVINLSQKGGGKEKNERKMHYTMGLRSQTKIFLERLAEKDRRLALER